MIARYRERNLLRYVTLNMPQDVEECQTSILLTEEVLLEGLCFDFVVDSPHAELVDLFDARSSNNQQVEECAWSIANDS